MITEAEKQIILRFEKIEPKLEQLGYNIIRDEDYKYIITDPNKNKIDFYTKSNKLCFRHNYSWNDFGIEYFEKLLDKVE